MESNQVHVRCVLLGTGMFPNEVAVKIETVQGNPVSVMVDRSLLETYDSENYMRVTLSDSKESISICLLPIEPESGSRWIRVQNAALLENHQKFQVA